MITIARFLCAVVVLATSSCAQASRAPVGESAPDGTTITTITGIVSITGTSFDQQLQLRIADVVVRLVAQPSDSAALARLGGLELSVSGANDSRGFRVSSFTVLRAGDQPVADGVLVQDGALVALQTSGGRRTLGNPPDALRRMIGARVWVAGPLDVGPNSYGVIVPRP